MATLMLDKAIRPIAPMNRSEPLRFLEQFLREHFAANGVWPTVRVLLRTAGAASRAGKWAPPRYSKLWKDDPERYFRGYITWGLLPENQCLAYMD